MVVMKAVLYFTVSIVVGQISSIGVLASTLTFDVSPTEVKPMLTSSLTLRCGVRNDPGSQARQIHNGLGAVTWEPSDSVDIDHIVSIIISKVNGQSSEMLATVTPFDQATAVNSYHQKIMVEGSAVLSPAAGELGYLKVTIFRPNDGGTFHCDVAALTTDRLPASLSKSFEVNTAELTISDLVKYIVDQDTELIRLKKHIIDLDERNKEMKRQLDSLTSNLTMPLGGCQEIRHEMDILTSNMTSQTNDLWSKVNGLKGQNIQTGFDVCHNQFIQFSKPYAAKPKVLTTFLRLGFTINSGSGDSPYIFQVNTESITETGFNVTCISSGRSTISDFLWLAIDV